MSDSTFDYVLFDLGGVLIELGGVSTMGEMAGIDSLDEVWRRWLSCQWVRRFERGWCSADEFANGVVTDWDLTVAPDEFIEQFRSWPVGMFDGAIELVAKVGARVPVGCLSNSNQLHWDHQHEHWGLGDLFQVHFASHLLGLIKPDREIFDHVITALDTSPERVLFLDDNLINVEGARSVGLTAEHVRGVDAARTALIDHAVLAPGATT